MSTRTPPEHLVVVMSRGGAKSHVMDRRYAPVGKAICGAGVKMADRPSYGIESVGCSKCRELTR